MRVLLTSLTIVATIVEVAAGQAPGGELYRGPAISSRVATFIAPERGAAIECEQATFLLGVPLPLAELGRAQLLTNVRSHTVRVVPVNSIVLRVAVGPTTYGMVTFRMRGQSRLEDPEDSKRIRPGNISRSASFVIADGEESPGYLLFNPRVRVVFTVERVYADDGRLIFDNPDTIELLWEALGRPSFTQASTTSDIDIDDRPAGRRLPPGLVVMAAPYSARGARPRAGRRTSRSLSRTAAAISRAGIP